MPSVGVLAYQGHLDDLSGRIGATAYRPETTTRIRSTIGALAAELPTKNCWTLAEAAGERDPHGIQHLLGRASWDQEAALVQVRDLVTSYLGDPGAVLVGDETGHAKRGVHTVGVGVQYSGAVGGTANAQVSVHLSYASSRGHALIDAELYLPACWTDDRQRCTAAGVPADVGFATKPTLLGDMIERAVRAGVPAAWVAADEVYGNDPKLARRLEALGLGYVLAVRSNRHLPIDAYTSWSAARIAADLPACAWQTMSAGAGAQGERRFEWAWQRLHPRLALQAGSAPRARRKGVTGPTSGKPVRREQWQQMLTDAAAAAPPGGRCWSLLVRRDLRSKELTYYLCFSPTVVALRTLVAVAGQRWVIEVDFKAAKSLTGLDEHQVRRWRSWRRWMVLVLAAYAVLALAVLTARRSEAEHPERDEHGEVIGLVALTCAEIRHLLAAWLRRAAEEGDTLAWSLWRRRHQHRAKQAHEARRQRLTGSE